MGKKTQLRVNWLVVLLTDFSIDYYLFSGGVRMNLIQSRGVLKL